MADRAPKAANLNSVHTAARRARVETPSHGDIMDAVRILSDRQDTAERHVDLMTMTVQRIEKALTEGLSAIHLEMTAIKDSIGDEGQDEYGKPIGRGVVGRLMRMERRIGRYDGWVKWATGALFAAGVFGSILWWAWEAKLKAVLG